MRSYEFKPVMLVALAMLLSPQISNAQDEREFVFTDQEGHLVLRFVGLGPGGLSTNQRDEVVNAEFSSMVHDHLRADLRFEAEPIDSEWSHTMESRIQTYFSETTPDFLAVAIECRSDSCRIRLEHELRWDIAEHQARLDQFRLLIDRIIEDNPASFEPSYMIAAYEKRRYTPNIKGFLRRLDPGS